MAKLVWDAEGSRLYETGVSNCALYVWDPKGGTDKKGGYGTGVAWNGISSIQETPTGADEEAIYADNIKYLSLRAVEEFEATVEAYTYPDEFAVCDGSVEPVTGVYFGQQSRRKFCLAFKTKLGNDEDFEDHGYKLHIIYGATASPSERSYETINDSPEAITFSWDLTTVPVENTHGKNVSNIVIDSTKFATTELKAKLDALEATLFGSDSKEAAIVMPDELVTALSTGE